MSYAAYAAKIAKQARLAHDAEIALQQQATLRRAAKRKELQPQLDAIMVWQQQQLLERGMCSEVLQETQTKLEPLFAAIANA